MEINFYEYVAIKDKMQAEFTEKVGSKIGDIINFADYGDDGILELRVSCSGFFGMTPSEAEKLSVALILASNMVKTFPYNGYKINHEFPNDLNTPHS